MNTEHTPEPWPELEQHKNPCYDGMGNRYAVRLSRNDYNHARLCVNACSGMADGELAGFKLIGSIKKYIAALQRQRDEAEQRRDELLYLNAALVNAANNYLDRSVCLDRIPESMELDSGTARDVLLDTIAKAGA